MLSNFYMPKVQLAIQKIILVQHFVKNSCGSKNGVIVFNYNAANSFHVLRARGELSDWTTTYHITRMTSNEPISVHEKENYIFIGGNTAVSNYLKSHAAIMCIAWTLMIPTR